MSKIEWTEKTWNPVTGCTKISQGCKNCYAERMAKRLKAMGQEKYRNEFQVTMHGEPILSDPYSWSKPSMIFVCSMSDLFHRDVPFAFIAQVFDTMRQANWHTYQVLTKRPERMRKFLQYIGYDWPPNVWAGTTVENQDVAAFRIAQLTALPRNIIKFLSCEPLLSPLPRLRLGGIDWVIIGGESGPRSRGMKLEWVSDIIDQCTASNTPVFVKQLGNVLAKEMGIKGKGNDPKGWPASIRVRQWPRNVHVKQKENNATCPWCKEWFYLDTTDIDKHEMYNYCPACREHHDKLEANYSPAAFACGALN